MHTDRSMRRVDFKGLAPAVLPSLLNCDFGNLEREIRRLQDAGAAGFHLDVMDGHFVPNISYGLPIVAAVRRLTRLPLDVHLMIANPADHTEPYVEAGADMLTIHFEAAGDPRPVLRRIRDLGASAGLAIKPQTPAAAIQEYLAECDLVLVMTVEPGYGGQQFQREGLDKLRQLRRMAGSPLLEVDGGLNASNAGLCAAAGADLFAVGSAIVSAPDYAAALDRLRQSVAAAQGAKGARPPLSAANT
jgi:ribulose-phosphate 3-epimerase